MVAKVEAAAVVKPTKRWPLRGKTPKKRVSTESSCANTCESNSTDVKAQTTNENTKNELEAYFDTKTKLNLDKNTNGTSASSSTVSGISSVPTLWILWVLPKC